MAWFRRSSPLTLVTVALILGLVINLPGKLQAQSQTPSLTSQLPAQWDPPSPPDAPAPVNRESGGIRGDSCKIPLDQKLLSLVPLSGIGKTTVDYPTVFWYMPETRASAVEFVLKDANARQLYYAKYNLAQSAQGVSGAPRIMSLKLPPLANLSPLKVDQTYYWELALICIDPDSGMEEEVTPFVRGGIQRVAPNPTLALDLQKATPKERVALYAKQRDWYETLRTLAELQQALPDDPEVAEAWAKLLNSVNLEPVDYESRLEPAINEP
ncbi:MAG TPA: hypothetical protein DD379_02845 [Cyanobacteria bacterium UBA11162]|nr:hypothetical protein [Cyanobacteria bacterium UBA11162]